MPGILTPQAGPFRWRRSSYSEAWSLGIGRGRLDGFDMRLGVRFAVLRWLYWALWSRWHNNQERTPESHSHLSSLLSYTLLEKEYGSASCAGSIHP